MKRILVESRPDTASVGIAAALRGRSGWARGVLSFEGAPVWACRDLEDVALVSVEDEHIRAEGLDRRLAQAGLEASLIVFLSRHRSQSGRPTLTVHPVGNFGEAKVGGQPGRIGPTDGPFLSHLLRSLARARDEASYPAEVSFEATHHGPLLATPSLFVELGSTASEWDNPRGHSVVAAAVQEALARPVPAHPVVIGLGGGHYAPRFTEAVLTRNVHVAHMLPSHHAESASPKDLAPQLRDASAGAAAFYYHDGTLPRAIRDLWFRALEASGLSRARSQSWEATTPRTSALSD